MYMQCRQTDLRGCASFPPRYKHVNESIGAETTIGCDMNKTDTTCEIFPAALTEYGKRYK